MVNYSMIFAQTKELSVLLVEDYEPLRNDMAELFEDLFKSVTVASDGKEALKYYESYQSANNKGFDLLITDIQMPVMNGVELSRSVRKIDPDQEIIVLSAHKDPEFLIPLINIGISYFLTKPIRHDELIDILSELGGKIAVSSAQTDESPIVQLGGGFAWDHQKCILSTEGVPVELTRYELILLQLFIEKSELICTTEEILYCFDAHRIEMSEKNIRNLISKLRKKLPSDLISNIYGMGYKLTLKT